MKAWDSLKGFTQTSASIGWELSKLGWYFAELQIEKLRAFFRRWNERRINNRPLKIRHANVILERLTDVCNLQLTNSAKISQLQTKNLEQMYQLLNEQINELALRLEELKGGLKNGKRT